MAWTIYCHTHIESGRRYVGLTARTWQRRWSQHVSQAERLSRKGWSHFANAIRKYGKDAFSHEVLETCDTLEAANAAEERWIEELGTRDPSKGFNLMKGGLHVPHPVKNPWDRPEFRAKVIDSSRKALSDPAVRTRISEGLRLAHLDPDYARKKSDRAKWQWSDPSSRQRQLDATRKKSSSPSFREKARKRWHSPVYRAACLPAIIERSEREKNKTHCKNGHEYTPENTRINRKRGDRSCRACKNAQKNARKSHCPNGHELSPGNFYLNRQGARLCNVCHSRPKKAVDVP